MPGVLGALGVPPEDEVTLTVRVAFLPFLHLTVMVVEPTFFAVTWPYLLTELSC